MRIIGEVLVGVGGFSVYTCEQFTVWFPCYEGVEEGGLVVILSFHGEADGWVLLVEVAPKVIRVVLFHDGERVIYIALSFSRWFWGFGAVAKVCSSKASIYRSAITAEIGLPIGAPSCCS